MPFSTCSTLEKTLKAFPLTGGFEPFVVAGTVEISLHLREDMDFMEKFVGMPRTESARRENLIYPILKEVWKRFPQLQLWSNVPVEYDSDLTGTPDYFLSARSERGYLVVEQLYLLVMETKKDDFDWGWGQCLAGMLAARKINSWPEQVVYGIVTNGRNWQFGKLQGDRFTQDPNSLNWLPLENLCAAITFMFEQCRLQLANYAGAA